MSRPDEGQAEPVVLYEVRDGVAWITMNRPQYHNAQNSKMTYALDASFRRAVDDDAVKAIVLRGAGKNFSAGHDIGTPGRDVDVSYERVHLLPDHVGRPGAEFQYVREEEVYLGMCRRWRDIPKPTVAMVQGACIAGGLMLRIDIPTDGEDYATEYYGASSIYALRPVSEDVARDHYAARDPRPPRPVKYRPENQIEHDDDYDDDPY